MQKIATQVLLKLHECVLIPSLFYAAETRSLSAVETKQIDRIDLWALKRLFGLPPTTPTPAVRFMTGTMYASVRIQMMQLTYLHDLLQKGDGHWANESLDVLVENNALWGKRIIKTLEEWELEEDFNAIKLIPKITWKRRVELAADKMNKALILEDCQTKQRGISREKTKTKSVIEIVERDNYRRNPSPLISKLSCLETRALIMGRYGMLECKANFSCGYGSKICDECNVEDNESHRMNHCPKYRSINRYDESVKVNFGDIYSDELKIAGPVIEAVLSMWDLANGRNKMKGVVS